MAVTIYSTPTCGFCKAARQYFRAQHVPFTEYDVSADQRKAEEMVRKSGQLGVPVIEVNGKVIVGFNRPEIDKALKK
jgi:glutaredoxin 3